MPSSFALGRGEDSGSFSSKALGSSSCRSGLNLGEGADQTVFLPEAHEIYQMQVTLGFGKHLLF